MLIADVPLSTWRSLVPILENNPLAVCDARSIDPEDLIPTDRVVPTRHGEVYYLRYNKDQKWCWLEHMRADEPLIMLMYDTHNEGQAKCKHSSVVLSHSSMTLVLLDCPHVPFTNSRAPIDAVTRHSVETRSIVITEIL